MSVSETLRKVVNSGFYNNVLGYMCFSLDDAWYAGLITGTELGEARKEIMEFICDYHTMSGFLKAHGVRYDYEYKKALYSDWDNRHNYLVKEELTFWQKVKMFFKRDDHHA